MRNLIVLFLIFHPFFVRSATVTWVGGGSDDFWSNDTNWDGGATPKPDDDVVINSSLVIVAEAAACKSISLSFASALTILSDGRIDVGGSTEYGIEMLNSSLIIEGVLAIKDTQLSGVHHSGTIENRGMLSILNANLSRARFKDGIDGNNGQITNYTDGVIIISGVQGESDFSAGLSTFSSTVFDNFGEISISDMEVAGIIDYNGQFNNSGDIFINSIEGQGINLRGVFNNNAGGRIFLEDIESRGIAGIVSSNFNNMGEIEMRNLSSGGISNSGAFINSASISLIDTGFEGILSVGASSSFANMGEIVIQNCVSVGIRNEGHYVNEGNILVADMDNIGIQTSGLFENKSTLRIENSIIEGLVNLDSFINYPAGEFSILRSAKLNNSDGAVLLNDGELILDACLEDCVVNEGNIINSNSISISNASLNGFYNIGSLYNLDESVVLIENNPNEAAIFNDQGFIESKGLIQLSNIKVGLLNDGMTINEDSILIHNVGLYGLFNSDTILNMTGGLIEIDVITDPASTALLNINPHSYIVNDGLLTISNADGMGIGILEGQLECSSNGEMTTTNIIDLLMQINVGVEYIINGKMEIDD